MASDLPTTDAARRSPADGHRVVPFRPRVEPRGGLRWPIANLDLRDTPVAKLEKFERVEREDDYRHRMTMNVLALFVTVLLVIAGVWLAERMAETVKTQDCFLSGRRNCAPIDVERPERG